MRYALVSDLHGNLEALTAVLEHAATQRIERYLCVGDLVGYGADPQACLARMQACQAVCVCGNHEWGSLGKLRPEWFNDTARQALVWTREQLDFRDLDALRRLPLVTTEGSLTLVHGTLTAPEQFEYLTDVGQALDTLRVCRTPICVVGNTHVPFVLEFDRAQGQVRRMVSAPNEVAEVRLSTQEGVRYVMNPGSVGQPRDGDPRASYAVLDTEESAVWIHRVAYDIGAAQAKIRRANLPALIADRLALGR